MTKLTNITSMNEISHIEFIKWIPASDLEHAQELLDNGEYSKGWYYRPRKNTKRLIVLKEEYDRNQYQEIP
jgi:hypothetical protein